MNKELKAKADKMLRAKALSKLCEGGPDTIAELPKEYLMEILHELQVHQIELQLQNEELIIARSQLEDSKNEYLELYDLAPVAYFSMSSEGIITKANHVASQKLMRDKHELIGRRFQKYIVTQYLSAFHAFIRRLFNDRHKQSIELVITDSVGAKVWVLLEAAVPLNATSNGDSCLVTLIDLTEQKKAQEILRASIEEKERIKIIIATQEEERKRVSEALHNSVAQSLYAMQLMIGEFEMHNHSQTLIEKLHDTVTNCIHETRIISFELSPSILQDFGLETTIEELAEKKSDSNLRITCNFNTHGQRLPPHLESGIYRIVQELVNNIQKHAQATRATLRYEIVKNHIKVVVEDNGKGFSVENEYLNKEKTGLRNIKNRVLLMNGNIDFHSTHGNTSVIIEIPIEN